MSEVTQPDSIGSMRLYDTLSFETAHGLVDVLRVAPGWVYAWCGIHITVMVPWNHFMDRVEGPDRFIR